MKKPEITYLKSATNLQELKDLYFKLAKQYHPDINKTANATKIMQQINNEYDYLKTVLRNASDTKKSSYETKTSMDSFKTVIDKLIKYPRITIEIVGSWLWISGTGTFKIKEEILYNDLHCEYSKGNKKFYWYEGIENKEGFFKGGYLKKAIDKYGIETIKSNNTPVMALS